MGICDTRVTTQTMIEELDSKFGKMHQRLVALDEHVIVSERNIGWSWVKSIFNLWRF